MIEIEHKFLVVSEAFKAEALRYYHIKQGFLNTHPERTVRVRIQGNKGVITVKGKPNDSHLSRFEWEKEIPLNNAEDLLKLCEPTIIDKTRYEITQGPHIFEVDVFNGENEGLVVAEIEVTSEGENFIKPSWLGKEVTGDVRYYNSQLSKNPYKNWRYD